MLGIPAVNNTKWRVNKFSKERQVEFWNDTTHVGVTGKVLGFFDDFRDKPGTNIRNALVPVPLPDVLQIYQRGLSKTDTCQVHYLFQSQL